MEEEKPVSVRMPAELKDAIFKVTTNEQRSMNQTILFLLRLALNVYAQAGAGGSGKLLELIEVSAQPARVFADYITVGEASKQKLG